MNPKIEAALEAMMPFEMPLMVRSWLAQHDLAVVPRHALVLHEARTLDIKKESATLERFEREQILEDMFSAVAEDLVLIPEGEMLNGALLVIAPRNGLKIPEPPKSAEPKRPGVKAGQRTWSVKAGKK